MTGKEMIEKVKALVEQYEDDYSFIAIRFEDQERQVGETIEENSRHNSDREDEREYPKFGTEDYEEMEELDGICAWDINTESSWSPSRLDDLASKQFITNHCYLIASDRAGSTMNYDPDHGEILLQKAEVIARLF